MISFKVIVKQEEEALSPSISAGKEAVAMEDDEMGKLWACFDICNNNNSSGSTSHQTEAPVFSLSSSTPPSIAVDVDGAMTSSPAVFPSPLPMATRQSETKPVCNGVGSSRRKPCKANLVQLKQPKTLMEEDTTPHSCSSEDFKAIDSSKKPRLDSVVETTGSQ